MNRSALSTWALCLVLAIAMSLLVTQRLLFSDPTRITALRGVIYNNTSTNTTIGRFIGQGAQIFEELKKNLSAEDDEVAEEGNEEENEINEMNEENTPATPSHTTPDKPKAQNLRESIPTVHENFVSPHAGTDITTHPIALIKCQNQTRCIHPMLQLQPTYKVYYCKRVSYGVRFYYLVREGLLQHPNIQLVETPEESDYIVYLPESAAWHKSECAKPEYSSKLVVLDEGDGPQIMNQPGDWRVLYFKRSFVSRKDGVFKHYMNYLHNQDTVLPMAYVIADAYVRPQFSTLAERNIDILCTLRDDSTRSRVKGWVREYAMERKIDNYHAGQVDGQSRTTVSTSYFDQMYKSRIIVTANPANWEGDFRFMEAMASGALVFVDRMYTPKQFDLQDEVHVIYYDSHNKTELFSELDAYRADTAAARHVAVAGYLHAMKYHRAVSLIDYVFRTVHIHVAKKNNQPVPKYVETGFDTRQRALDLKIPNQQHRRRATRRVRI